MITCLHSVKAYFQLGIAQQSRHQKHISHSEEQGCVSPWFASHCLAEPLSHRLRRSLGFGCLPALVEVAAAGVVVCLPAAGFCRFVVLFLFGVFGCVCSMLHSPWLLRDILIVMVGCLVVLCCLSVGVVAAVCGLHVLHSQLDSFSLQRSVNCAMVRFVHFWWLHFLHVSHSMQFCPFLHCLLHFVQGYLFTFPGMFPSSLCILSIFIL